MSQCVINGDMTLEIGSFDIISQACRVDANLKNVEDDFDPGTLCLDDVDDNWLEVDVVEESDHNVCELEAAQLVCNTTVGHVKLEVAGFKEVPHPDLADAGNGIKKMRSEKNNNWALRRADQLRSALGWDMSVGFGDLPLVKVDELLSNLFSRVVKIKGGEYPAESLMNMLGGYNRLLRRASDLRSLKDPNAMVLGREFDIKKHPAFTRTRLTLAATLKKTARDGTNKKRKKVNHITQAHEVAVLADLYHQIYHNQGWQKRTTFYLLVRCGIRGGDELWQLKRFDLEIKTDKHGREYVQYMERHSKNNDYSLDQNKEEQFRHSYHSYEADFELTVKQYLRHMPPWIEGNKDALFLGCIQSPASIVCFNRAFKVGKNTSSRWLENMLKLVGLPEKLFSNKSGRATLITRLASQGVPDEVGMLLSGHHTVDGDGRYDRTKELKKEATTMVAYNPGLNYEMALTEVSRRFVDEDMKGGDVRLKPLIDHVSAGSVSNAIMPVSGNNLPSTSTSSLEVQAKHTLRDLQNQVPKQIQVDCAMKLDDPASKLAMWNCDYDNIDWDAAIKRDMKLASLLGSLPNKPGPVTMGSGNTFSNCQNCTIQINLPLTFHPTGFNWGKMLEFNKENIGDTAGDTDK